MSDSFCVDFSALGQIPSLLAGVRSVLDANRVEAVAAAAATAVAPGSGKGITLFGQALDDLVAKGSTAIGDDATNLGRTAASYERCELGAVRSAETLDRSLGSGQ